MKLEAKHRLQARTLTPLTKESGAYVSVTPDATGLRTLSELAIALGVVTDVDKLHCTLSYAKNCFPTAGADNCLRFGAKIVGIEFWDGHDNDGYLVVKFDSPDLEARNRFWTSHGLKHSFDDYTPHSTLVSKLEKTPELIIRIGKVVRIAYGRSITFTNETIEGIKPSSKD